jgi:hypothetical protein
MMAFVADIGVLSLNDLAITALVVRHDGSTMAVTSLRHASDASNGEHYWDWMPFQKGQQSKTEELQNELGKLQASVPSSVDGKR